MLGVERGADGAGKGVPAGLRSTGVGGRGCFAFGVAVGNAAGQLGLHDLGLGLLGEGALGVEQ
jgi:hypothetical protein